MRRILMRILIISFCIFLVISGIRWYNGHKTEKLAEIRPESREAIAYLKGFDYDDYAKSNIEGVTVEAIRTEGLVGYRFRPDTVTRPGKVITLGGSEGNIDYVHSVYLAQHGFDVYTFYYFGQKGLPKELVEVDLGIVKKMIAYAKNSDTAETTDTPITVLGGSKGAEMALLAAATYPDDIDHLVLYAPSAYVWQGLSKDYRTAKSSWTVDGKPVPYLTNSDLSPSIFASFFVNGLFNRPMALTPLHAHQLERDDAPDYLIPMQHVHADVLAFAGEDDDLWPSATMARTIKEALGDRCELVLYEKTGHVFLGPTVLENLVMGGRYENNVQALKESNKMLLSAMEKWHATPMG